jgi:Histidinol phosphatase and related phosphatases
MISAIDRTSSSISAILYCPSLPTSIDPNRKPSPNMFIDIAKKMNIKLSNCYAISDSPHDIEASVAAKCIPLPVRTSNRSKIENNNKFKVPIFDNLYDPVDFVLKN